MQDRLLTIDTQMGGRIGRTAVFVVLGEATVLIDTGPAQTAGEIVRVLEDRAIRIDSVAVTHAHLDHAGACGRLALHLGATVAAPAAALRHLADPDRLWRGTCAVYGEAEAAARLGRPRSVPTGLLVGLRDGDVVPGAGELVAVATPGHTREHLSFLDQRTGTLLAGDAVGIVLPTGALRPSLPPADCDPDRALISLELLRGLGAEAVAVTHFGVVAEGRDAVERLFARATSALERWLVVGQRAAAGADGHTLAAAAERELTAAERSVLDDINPVWLNLAGLEGWASRRTG